MKNRTLILAFAPIVILSAACGGTEPLPGIDATTDDGPDADAPDDQVVVPDREAPPDSEPRLCTIDLVFAVDNSSSMQEEIGDFRLNVWPRFAEALQEISGGTTGEPFRAAVIDGCPYPATFHVRGQSGPCNFVGGQAWMTSDSPNLVAEFQCVGDIWDDDSTCTGNNDDEQPATAAATSLAPPWTDPGEANAGFLRSNALLIVIAITDEDEQPDPAASADIVYQRLIRAKGDDPKKMVFLGIGGSRSCEGVYGSAREAVTLKALTDLFIARERGIFWDLCEGNLEDGLGEAMSVIDTACDELVI
jgi:hypothetical protein